MNKINKNLNILITCDENLSGDGFIQKVNYYNKNYCSNFNISCMNEFNKGQFFVNLKLIYFRNQINKIFHNEILGKYLKTWYINLQKEFI